MTYFSYAGGSSGNLSDSVALITCRNSVQGKALLADDRGKWCPVWEDSQPWTYSHSDDVILNCWLIVYVMPEHMGVLCQNIWYIIESLISFWMCRIKFIQMLWLSFMLEVPTVYGNHEWNFFVSWCKMWDANLRPMLMYLHMPVLHHLPE